MYLCVCILAHERKVSAFIVKVSSRCFCWFPAAILVYQSGTPIWRLHTKLCKVAWNVSANNTETVYHTDLRLGEVVYVLNFSNISFSWLFSLNGFEVFFFMAWQWKRSIHQCKVAFAILTKLVRLVKHKMKKTFQENWPKNSLDWIKSSLKTKDLLVSRQTLINFVPS